MVFISIHCISQLLNLCLCQSLASHPSVTRNKWVFWTYSNQYIKIYNKLSGTWTSWLTKPPSWSLFRGLQCPSGRGGAIYLQTANWHNKTTKYFDTSRRKRGPPKKPNPIHAENINWKVPTVSTWTDTYDILLFSNK